MINLGGKEGKREEKGEKEGKKEGGKKKEKKKEKRKKKEGKKKRKKKIFNFFAPKIRYPHSLPGVHSFHFLSLSFLLEGFNALLAREPIFYIDSLARASFIIKPAALPIPLDMPRYPSKCPSILLEVPLNTSRSAPNPL